jgi:E3 ubiquitin-protein ligase BRE1
MTLLETKLHNAEAEKQQYYEQLIAAEKRLDRLQSKTVATLNSAPRPSDDDSSVVKAELKEGVKSESVEPGPSSHSSPKPEVC